MLGAKVFKKEGSQMAKRSLSLPLIVALAVTVSACATKKKDLPPPPPPATAVTPESGPLPSENAAVPPVANVGNANVPGSAADFAAQSGADFVLFGTDSYELDDEARTTLGKQAEWLARYPSVRVTIEGHADERGTREYNLALGDRRAAAAKNFLAAQGVDTSRMTTISYGKERPAVEGNDEAAWARNRRAVTVVAG
jgi:peptidoglycan-associated lipoprotein